MAKKSTELPKARLARRKGHPRSRGIHRLVKDLPPYWFSFHLDYAPLKLIDRMTGTAIVPRKVREHFRELFIDVARQYPERPGGLLDVEIGWHTQEPLNEDDDRIFRREFVPAINAAQRCQSYGLITRLHHQLRYYVRTDFIRHSLKATKTCYPGDVGTRHEQEHVAGLSLEQLTAPGIPPGDVLVFLKEAITALPPEHKCELYDFLAAQLRPAPPASTEHVSSFPQAVRLLLVMPDRIRSGQQQIKDEYQSALKAIAGQHLDTYEENRQLTDSINTIRHLLGVAFRDEKGRRVSLTCVDPPGCHHGRFDIKPSSGKRSPDSKTSFHRLEIYDPSE